MRRPELNEVGAKREQHYAAQIIARQIHKNYLPRIKFSPLRFIFYETTCDGFTRSGMIASSPLLRMARAAWQICGATMPARTQHGWSKGVTCF